MPDTSPLSDSEHEYPHWNRIYIVVVIFTALVIAALAIFSATFTP